MFGLDNRFGKLPYDIMSTATAASYSIVDYSMHNRTCRCLPCSPEAISFRFGYGLSFTSFSMTMKSVEEITASQGSGTARRQTTTSYMLTLSNVGFRSGDAIVTAYFRPDAATAAKAGPSSSLLQRQLFDFDRIALGPGRSVDVTFEASAEVLRLVNENGERVAVHGVYTLFFSLGQQLAQGSTDELSVTITV